jgi:hypothetical protein
MVDFSLSIHTHTPLAAEHLFTHGARRNVVKLPGSGFVQHSISDVRSFLTAMVLWKDPDADLPGQPGAGEGEDDRSISAS